MRPVSIEIGRRLVIAHHYARGTSNTRTYLHGLFPADSFWDEECMGVTWWIPPTKAAALATFPNNWQGVLSLSRLVIVPEMPKNACSFLIARSMKLIDRSKWPCLVTYADSWRGHEGTIYQAANWEYVGETAAEEGWIKNGRLISRKAGPKTRTADEMRALGAESIGRHTKKKFVHIKG